MVLKYPNNHCLFSLTVLNKMLLVLTGRPAGSLKGELESNGLRVNVKKTKMILSSGNAGKVTIEGKFPCAVCKL